MINESKMSIQPNSKIMLDLLLLGLGVVVGGVLALLGVWLWLDYHSNPTHSLLGWFSLNLAGWLPLGWRSWLGQEAQVLGLPLSIDTKAYWYMARAGGLVGYLLLWLSVVWGLILSTKITEGRVSPVLAYGLHEFLSLGTILFATIHALVLLGDRYIGFNIFHLALPFLAPYKPFWTGLGTLGLYLSAVLTGSFYLRKQIGQTVWRALHYFTFVAYILALVHGIMAGTDNSVGAVQGMYLITGCSVLFLVYYRLFTLKVKAAKPVR